MIPDILRAVLGGGSPDPGQLEAALDELMVGELDEALAAALLVALAGRPPEGAVLAAGARVLRRHRTALRSQLRPLVDTCGTGGDGSGTFNISTAAAFVVAAAGCGVAKHGNRAVSSKVGSADVLEELGLVLDLEPAASSALLDATGFTFLFAPRYHPTMARLAPLRRRLQVRTLFNLLGPLSNPALAEVQVLGVGEPGLVRPMAEALLELGSDGALVVHCDGLDECGLHGTTRGLRLRDGALEDFAVAPEDVGLSRAPVSALRSDGREEAAEVLRDALAGDTGPTSEVVALNAGAALMVAEQAPDLPAGVALARELMASGEASRVLERSVATSARLAPEVPAS